MRLLFDQNLSRRLVDLLADLYPNAQHVAPLGLERAADTRIWLRAVAEQAVIVTKDSDFLHRSLLLGHPPKVIWIAFGNCSTRAVERALRDAISDVEKFVSDDTASFLIVE